MAEPPRDPFVPGGALTGETGDLTAGEDEPFIPAERREATDPELEGAMTLLQRREADRQHDDESAGGYGSSHGLAEDDPAYRMETRPEPEAGEEDQSPDEQTVQPGVDEFSPPEREHL